MLVCGGRFWRSGRESWLSGWSAAVLVGACQGTPSPLPDPCIVEPTELVQPPPDLSALGFGANMRPVRYGDLEDPYRHRAMVVAATDLVRFEQCYWRELFEDSVGIDSPEVWVQPRPDGQGFMSWGANFCQAGYRRSDPSYALGPPEHRQPLGELVLVDFDPSTGETLAPARTIPVQPIFSQYFRKQNRPLVVHSTGRSLFVGDLLPCREEDGRPVGCGDEIIASGSHVHAFYLFEPDPLGPAPYRQVAGYPIVDDPVGHPFQSWDWTAATFPDAMLRPWAISAVRSPSWRPSPSPGFLMSRLGSLLRSPDEWDRLWMMTGVQLPGLGQPPHIASEAIMACAYHDPLCGAVWTNQWSFSGQQSFNFIADDFDGDGAPDLVFFHHGPRGLMFYIWPGDPDDPAKMPDGPPLYREWTTALREIGGDPLSAVAMQHVASGRFWEPDRAALLLSLRGHGYTAARDFQVTPMSARAVVCQILFTTWDWQIDQVECWPDPTRYLDGTIAYGNHLQIGDVLPDFDADGRRVDPSQARPEVMISVAASPLVPGRVDIYRTSAERGVEWESPAVVLRSAADDRQAFGYATHAVWASDDADLQTLLIGAPSRNTGRGGLYRVDLSEEDCP